MKKVELDEIEGKALLATQDEWIRGAWVSTLPGSDVTLLSAEPGRISTRNTRQEVVFGCGCCSSPDASDGDADHIAANSPPVTLALTARIRELEAMLPRVASDLEGWVQSESQHADHASDPSWKLAEEVRALLEKGVVLP